MHKKLNIVFQRVVFERLFLLQILENKNHAATMPGISFLSHSRLIFCNFKIYRVEK